MQMSANQIRRRGVAHHSCLPSTMHMEYLPKMHRQHRSDAHPGKYLHENANSAKRCNLPLT